ncbi:thermonuclease family protein [Mesobacterium pallidum]|uniref:thermonuclease family protein n=1 Tax=Mesobacterium pallidum TaxID=2872037 RepID=UPI001EE2CFB2|nr:thermonuclease family protein [Mesobacterium pallidum]
MRKFWPLVLSMLLAVSLPVSARTAEPDITGIPEVIDADILKFGQQRVILWGVDAPDPRQQCWINGTYWGCHEAAKRRLQLLAGRGEVSCTFKGEPDPFHRYFGVCTSGGQDLSAEMVKSGLALAYTEQSEDYLPQMAESIAESAGLWQVGVLFEEPWLFRRRETPGGFR